MAPNFSDEKLDPDLKLISFNKKRYRPDIERGVSYIRNITVSLQFVIFETIKLYFLLKYFLLAVPLF